MIIDFLPYLERRRSKQSLADHLKMDMTFSSESPRSFAPSAVDYELTEYRSAFLHLWPRVHAAILPNDLYANDTDRRLGLISNLALYLVDSWPANLKGFLYRKFGEGCLTQASLNELLPLIDMTASKARLRPLDQVKSEQISPMH